MLQHQFGRAIDICSKNASSAIDLFLAASEQVCFLFKLAPRAVTHIGDLLSAHIPLRADAIQGSDEFAVNQTASLHRA